MEQIVRPVQATPLISPADATVSFEVEYTTDDPLINVGTGLGLRLHWDSTQLTFDSLDNFFPDDFLVEGTPTDDINDDDGDPNTDRLIIVSWVDFTGGTWPDDPETLPAVLYTANFTTSADFVEETTINFTASSTSPGFELVATPVIIQAGELPEVTIAATDAEAAEEGLDPGTFTITRTGDTTEALSVEYTVAGTADGAEGADYTPELTGTATIEAGSESVDITITPVDDGDIEEAETVELTLVDTDSYDLGAETVATVTIADNDEVLTPVVTISATDAEAAEEGPDPGTFTITRTGDTTEALSVDYTIAGTADDADLSLPLTGTAIIEAGSESVDITITPVDDDEVEDAETVELTLVDTDNYDLGAETAATVTIADNDAVPATTVTIAATDANASEAGDTGTFTITREGDTTEALIVEYAVSGGTATNGTDYTPAPVSPVTIPAGESSVEVIITPIDDDEVEEAETVELTLVDTDDYDLGAETVATVTIADDDGDAQIITPVPESQFALADEAVSIDVQYSTNPANTGTTGLGLRLHWDSTSLTFDSLADVLEDDRLAQGEATPDTDDFDDDPTTDTFILVSWADITGGSWPNDDPLTLPVSLYTANFTTASDFADSTSVNFSASSVAPGFGLRATSGTIEFGEPPTTPTVTIAATDADAAEEGPDPGTFTITRTGDTTEDLTVEYTVAGSADGADYSPELTGSATIAAGESSVEITITPVDDDEGEGPETVELTVVDAEAYDLGAETSATVTIADNDEVITLGGQIITPVPETQSAPAGGPVSIEVQYSTDPAQSETTGLGLRLHWDSSSLSFGSLDGVLADDLIAAGDPQEDTEDFDDDDTTDRFLLVSWADLTGGSWPDDPSNLPVGLYTANFTTTSDFAETTTLNFSASSTSPDFELRSTSATIEFDPDIPVLPQLSIGDATVTEGDEDETDAVFTVTLSSPSDVDVTVDFTTAAGTATVEDNDYAAASGTITFAPGETTQEVTVEVIGDSEVEPDENFFVNLSNASGATIAGVQGTGTIVNDDEFSTEPDLTISITDAPDQVTENNPLTYTLTVSNVGGGAATDIVVEDALPFSFIPTNVDDADFTHSLTNNVITFSGGSLDPGESTVLTIEGMAPTTGPFPIAVNNTAVVDPDNAIAESDETNNIAIEPTTVTPAPLVIERVGTDGDDTLVGTPISDRLEGLAGDDVLIGRASADLLKGGEGGDSLYGGAGNDILYGQEGNDTLFGGGNNDTLYGGLGKDFLEGGTESDVFVLASDEGTSDINQADIILAYQVGIDQIGLTDGLTFSDLSLEETVITVEFGGLSITAESTAIVNTTSNDILGVVFEVKPDRIDASNFVPVQVGLF